MSLEISRFANGMNVHTICDLACHAKHPRIDSSDIDFRVGSVDLSRTPLGSDERELVELSTMFEWSAAKCTEAGFDCKDVVAKARTRSIEGHPVPTFDVCLHLCAEAETESTR
jgi:hypothetical protein